jgi:hypothetical protein
MECLSLDITSAHYAVKHPTRREIYKTEYIIYSTLRQSESGKREGGMTKYHAFKNTFHPIHPIKI